MLNQCSVPLFVALVYSSAFCSRVKVTLILLISAVFQLRFMSHILRLHFMSILQIVLICMCFKRAFKFNEHYEYLK